MKTPILTLLTLSLFISGSFVLKGLHSPQLQRNEKMNPMEAWLGFDCMNKELNSQLVTNLRREAKMAEQYFMRIIEEGLPKEVLAAAENDYARFYEYRQQFLADGDRKIILRNRNGKEKEWSAPKVSQGEYVSERVKTYQTEMQTRAMEGLAVLRTATAKDYLQELAKNTGFEHRELAQELLEQRR